MANVYSKSLWLQPFTVGNITGPTVPSTVVWVVRTITVTCGGVPPSAQGPVLFTISGQFPIAGWSQLELAGGQTVTWQGNHVVPPGQYLNVQNSPPGAIAWSVSGYELTLP